MSKLKLYTILSKEYDNLKCYFLHRTADHIDKIINENVRKHKIKYFSDYAIIDTQIFFINNYIKEQTMHTDGLRYKKFLKVNFLQYLINYEFNNIDWDKLLLKYGDS
jgi:hypothetical protein